MTARQNNKTTDIDQDIDTAYNNRPLQERLALCALEANVVSYLVGPPGIGKTSFVSNLCKQRKWEYELLSAPHIEPSDITGLPEVSKFPDGKVRTIFAEPEWLHRLNNAPDSLLFIDELPLASSDTMKALLSLVEGRKAGTAHLSPHVRIVLAGNPLEWSMEASLLSAAMRTRVVFINWVLDVDNWLTYHRDGFSTWKAPNIPTDTPRMGEEKCIILDGILRMNPRFIQLESMDKAPDEGAFNVGRSWDTLYKLLRVIPAHDIDVMDVAVKGTVGEEIFQQVSANLRYTLPVLRTLIDPESYDWNDSRPDITYALLTAIADIGLNTSSTDASVQDAMIVCAVAADNGAADIAWSVLAGHILRREPQAEIPSRVALVFEGKLHL